MACEFSVILPAGFSGAVDAGLTALDEVERLERKLSVYLADSEISVLNRCGGSPDPPSRETYSLLRWATCLSAATGGAFDPAAGALVKAWGFYRGPKRVPSEAELEAALAASGVRHLHFDDDTRAIGVDREGVEFNLGAIGKGFAIDRALQLVRSRHGIRSALMSGGQSSIKAMGAWPVAIGDPPVARLWLRDRALGTSGAANQFFLAGGRRYGHVLDPRTGWPARGLISASAVAPSAAEADALSTAFYVMGVEATRRFCARHPKIGALLVTPDEILPIGNIEVTHEPIH